MASSRAQFLQQHRFPYDQQDEEEETCCSLVKQALVLLLGVVIYVLAVMADVNVAVADYRTGHEIYAFTTLALVLTPSLMFGLYMFCTSLMNHTGLLACCRGIMWLMLMPIMPFWPIIRGANKIYCALVGAFNERERPYYVGKLENPTSAHLLKFLQAFTASAPQLVVRLHKLAAADTQRVFETVSGAEMAQIGCGLLALSVAVVSTYNKSVTTQQVKDDQLSLNKLSFGCVLLALVWWWSFLAARLPCIALFIQAFEWWSAVLLGLHFLLMFALQTYSGRHHPLRRFFVYFFSGFVFIFVYLQINMKSRINSGRTPYVLFSLLAFVEQTGMLVSWQLVRQKIIPYYPLAPAYYYGDTTNATTTQSSLGQSTASATILGANSTDVDCFQYSGSEPLVSYLSECGYLVVVVHYALFLVSVLFMLFTFCCAGRRRQDDSDSDLFDEEKTCCC